MSFQRRRPKLCDNDDDDSSYEPFVSRSMNIEWLIIGMKPRCRLLRLISNTNSSWSSKRMNRISACDSIRARTTQNDQDQKASNWARRSAATVNNCELQLNRFVAKSFIFFLLVSVSVLNECRTKQIDSIKLTTIVLCMNECVHCALCNVYRTVHIIPAAGQWAWIECDDAHCSPHAIEFR